MLCRGALIATLIFLPAVFGQILGPAPLPRDRKIFVQSRNLLGCASRAAAAFLADGRSGAAASPPAPGTPF